MSLAKIHLRKLLQYFFADVRLQRSMLLTDIRAHRAKEEGRSGNGGDFYTGFWADIKAHAAGRSNISETTVGRIAANKGRVRLYPILTESFLAMWNEKMRWRNEPFEFVPESIKGRFVLGTSNTVVKIENTVGVRTWDGSYRVIYPYFSEQPALPNEGARLGFWALKEALPTYRMDEFRIVDFHRRAYFRPAEAGLTGNEGDVFQRKHAALLREWSKLRGLP